MVVDSDGEESFCLVLPYDILVEMFLYLKRLGHLLHLEGLVCDTVVGFRCQVVGCQAHCLVKYLVCLAHTVRAYISVHARQEHRYFLVCPTAEAAAVLFLYHLFFFLSSSFGCCLSFQLVPGVLSPCRPCAPHIICRRCKGWLDVLHACLLYINVWQGLRHLSFLLVDCVYHAILLCLGCCHPVVAVSVGPYLVKVGV